MEFKNPYWSTTTKIELLQWWIVIHSYLYYKLDTILVDDSKFDSNCRQLTKLMKSDRDASRASKYYNLFKDFSGVTGFDLFSRLNREQKSKVKMISEMILNA